MVQLNTNYCEKCAEYFGFAKQNNITYTFFYTNDIRGGGIRTHDLGCRDINSSNHLCYIITYILIASSMIT